MTTFDPQRTRHGATVARQSRFVASGKAAVGRDTTRQGVNTLSRVASPMHRSVVNLSPIPATTTSARHHGMGPSRGAVGCGGRGASILPAVK